MSIDVELQDTDSPCEYTRTIYEVNEYKPSPSPVKRLIRFPYKYSSFVIADLYAPSYFIGWEAHLITLIDHNGILINSSDLDTYIIYINYTHRRRFNIVQLEPIASEDLPTVYQYLMHVSLQYTSLLYAHYYNSYVYQYPGVGFYGAGLPGPMLHHRPIVLGNPQFWYQHVPEDNN